MRKNNGKEKAKMSGGARGKVFRKRLLDLTPSSEEESNDDEEEIDDKTEFSKTTDLLVKDSLDDVNIGKFFAVYWPKPRSYYWAKLLKVFANDSEEEADEVEMQFLKRVENTSDPTQMKWDWPSSDDIGIVDAKLCFAGPEVPDVSDSSRLKSRIRFPNEPEVLAKFNELCKNANNK